MCRQMLVDFLAATDEDDELRRQRHDMGKDKDDEFIENLMTDIITEDEDRAFVYSYAALLDTRHGKTLQQRAEWLSDQSPELLVALEEFMDVAKHGIEEKWTVSCKECGASRVIEQTLDALAFLPSLQRRGHTEPEV